MAPQNVTGVTTNVGAVNVDDHNHILEFEHFLVKVWESVRASCWGSDCVTSPRPLLSDDMRFFWPRNSCKISNHQHINEQSSILLPAESEVLVCFVVFHAEACV